MKRSNNIKDFRRGVVVAVAAVAVAGLVAAGAGALAASEPAGEELVQQQAALDEGTLGRALFVTKARSEAEVVQFGEPEQTGDESAVDEVADGTDAADAVATEDVAVETTPADEPATEESNEGLLNSIIDIVSDTVAEEETIAEEVAASEPAASAAEPEPEPAAEVPAAADPEATPEPDATEPEAPAPFAGTLSTSTRIAGHTYDIAAIIDASANVPEGTELVAEALPAADLLNARLVKALGIGEDDRLLQSAFFSVSLMLDAEPVSPAVPIRIELQTSAIDAGDSDAVELALFSGDRAHALAVQNLTDSASGATRVATTTDTLGELGIAVVVEPKQVWAARGDTTTVFGPRMSTLVQRSAVSDEEYVRGTYLEQMLVSELEPSHSWPTTLYLEASSGNQATAVEASGTLGFALKAGRRPTPLFGKDGTAEPVPLGSDELLALVWDSGYREESLDLGGLWLEGMLPLGTDVRASDVTATTDAEDVIAASDVYDYTTIAAYDLSFDVDGKAWEPGDDHALALTVDATAATGEGELQVWHTGERSEASEVAATAEGGQVQFAATEAGAYTVVERTVLHREVTASDGTTYDVTVSWDGTAGLPRDTSVEVREVAGAELLPYRVRSREALGGGRLAYIRAFDVTLVGPDGAEVEPTEAVQVSIRLADEDAPEEASVLHFADGALAADAPEVLAAESTPEDGACAYAFEATGFSVYAVAYTVDFHWGEYTYNLAGGSEIFLSELLTILAENGDDSAVEAEDVYPAAKLDEIAADMSRVSNVAFSDPALLKVEQKSSEQAENDWLLTSLAAFDTEEKLTLALLDGSEIVIRVTDVKTTTQDEDNSIFMVTDDNDGVFYCTTWKDVLENCYNKTGTNAGGQNNAVTIDVLQDYTFTASDIGTFPVHNQGNMTINGGNHTFTKESGVTGSLIDWKPTGASNDSRGVLTIKELTIDGGGDSSANAPLIKIETGTLTLSNTTVMGHASTAAGICAVDASTARKVNVEGATSITGNTANGTPANLNVGSTNKLNLSNNLTGTVGVTTTLKADGDVFAAKGSEHVGYRNLKNDADNDLHAELASATTIRWVSEDCKFFDANSYSYYKTLNEAVNGINGADHVIQSLVPEYTVDAPVSYTHTRNFTLQPGTTLEGDTLDMLTLTRGSGCTGDMFTTKTNVTISKVTFDGGSIPVTGALIKATANNLTLSNVTVQNHTATNTSCAVEASAATYVYVNGATTITGNTANGVAANLRVSGTNKLTLNDILTGTIGVTTDKKNENDQFAVLTSGASGCSRFVNDANESLFAGLSGNTAIKWFGTGNKFYIKKSNTETAYYSTLKAAIQGVGANQVIKSLVSEYTVEDEISYTHTYAFSIEPGETYNGQAIKSLTLKRGSSCTGDMITTTTNVTLNNITLDGDTVPATGSLIKMSGNGQLALRDVLVVNHTATTDAAAIDASSATTASYVLVSGGTKIVDNTANGAPANLKVGGNRADILKIDADLTGSVGVTTPLNTEGTVFAGLTSGRSGYDRLLNDTNPNLIAERDSTTSIKWVSGAAKFYNASTFTYHLTLKDAVDHITANNQVIRSLVDEYTVDEAVAATTRPYSIEPGEHFDILLLTRGSGCTGDMITASSGLTLSNIILDGNNVAASGALLRITNSNLTLNDVVARNHTASAGICAVETANAAKVNVQGATTITGNTAGGSPANLHVTGEDRLTFTGDLTGEIGVTTPQGEEQQFAVLGNAAYGGYSNLKNDTDDSLIASLSANTKIKWTDHDTYQFFNANRYTYHTTLEDALANVQDNNTVIKSLVSEYTLNNAVNYTLNTRSVTIQPGDGIDRLTIKRGDNVTGTLLSFTINAGYTVKLSDITVDGDNKDVNGSLIKVTTGRLTLSNVSVKNHKATNDACAVDASTSRLVTLGGTTTISGNTANGASANLYIPNNVAYTTNSGTLYGNIGITTDNYEVGKNFATWTGSLYSGWNNFTNDKLEDSGTAYFVSRRAAINGNIFWDAPESAINRATVETMFNNPVVDIELKTAPTEADLAQLPAGAIPGENNNEKTVPNMVWKSSTYNDDNSIDITLNYFQKQVGLKLDFIFVIDESGTMSENKTAQGVTLSQAKWARYAAARAAKCALDLNTTYAEYGVYNRVYLLSWDSGKRLGSGFLDDYDAALQFASSYPALGGGTDHSMALGYALDIARESVGQGRTPVVIYLSDFYVSFTAAEVGAATRALRQYTEYLYELLIYENYYTAAGVRTDTAKRMANMMPNPYHYYMEQKDDPSDLITPMIAIVKDAIAKCNANLGINDKMGTGDAVGADQNGISSTSIGEGTDPATYNAKTDTVRWDLINSSEEDRRLQTAQMYTKDIHIPMGDDVYSGFMPTNGEVTVKEGDKTVNSIDADDSPLYRRSVTLLLKGTNTSGTPLAGATFTLTRGSNTWELTTDNEGKIVLPWGETDTVGATTAESTVAFPAGSTYTLTQNTTVDGFVRPAGSWTLTVGNDYKITATTNASPANTNRTRDMVAKAGKFEIYNDAEPTVIYHYRNAAGEGWPANDTWTATDIFVEPTETSFDYALADGGTHVKYNSSNVKMVLAGWTEYNDNNTHPVYQVADSYALYAHGNGDLPAYSDVAGATGEVHFYGYWTDPPALVPITLHKEWDDGINWTDSFYAAQKNANQTITFNVIGHLADGTTHVARAYSSKDANTSSTADLVTTISASDHTDIDGTDTSWARTVYVERTAADGSEYVSYSIEEPNMTAVTVDGVTGEWVILDQDYQDEVLDYVETTENLVTADPAHYTYYGQVIDGKYTAQIVLSIKNNVNIYNITGVSIDYTAYGLGDMRADVTFESEKWLGRSHSDKAYVYQVKLITKKNNTLAGGYKPTIQKVTFHTTNGDYSYVNDGSSNPYFSNCNIEQGSVSYNSGYAYDMDAAAQGTSVTYSSYTATPRRLTFTNSFSKATEPKMPVVVHKVWNKPDSETADYFKTWTDLNKEIPLTVDGESKTLKDSDSVATSELARGGQSTYKDATEHNAGPQSFSGLFYVDSGFDATKLTEGTLQKADDKYVWTNTIEETEWNKWVNLTDSGQTQKGYIHLHSHTDVTGASNTEYQGIKKLIFQYNDGVNTDVIYQSTALVGNATLNVEGADYYIEVLLPSNVDMSSLALANPQSYQYTPKGELRFAIQVCRTGENTVNNLPKSVQGRARTSAESDTRYDNVSFCKNVPAGGTKIEASSTTLKAYFPTQYTITNSLSICKIVDTDGVEHGFPTLNAAVTYSRNTATHNKAYAVDDGNGGKQCKIEMLVDYVIPSGDKVTLDQPNDNIIITTAATEGGVYNFKPTFGATEGRTTQYEADGKTYKSGDSAETAILSRKSDFTSDSLFRVENASATLTTTNIIFDGRGISTAASGGIIRVSGKLYANAATTMRDSIVTANGSTGGNGGAIFLASGATAEESGLFIDGHSDNVIGNDDEQNKTDAKNATANAVNGGGIYVSSGASFTFTGGELTKCKASEKGGAIFNCGTLIMDENEESGDTHNLLNGSLEYCSAANGGAIYNAAGINGGTGGTVDMAGGYIEHCFAADNGGGIYTASTATQTVNSKEVGAVNLHTENQKPGVIKDCSAANGGGIYLAAGEMDMAGGTIEGCTAERKSGDSINVQGKADSGNGGGIYTVGTLKLTQDNATGDLAENIKSCVAQVNGGGIFIDGAGSVEITGGTIQDCRSVKNGGAIYDDATDSGKTYELSISNLIIKGHTSGGLDAETKNAEQGGGIYVSDGHVNITGGQILDCTAKEGGAIYHIYDRRIHDPKTNFEGKELILTNVTIDGHKDLAKNVVNAEQGGAVYIYNGYNNSNTQQYSPATGFPSWSGYTNKDVSQASGPKLDINGGSILDCTASGNGGAIYCNSPAMGRPTIAIQKGAVINGHDSLPADVWNSGKEQGNESNTGGGAIFFRRGTLKIDGSEGEVYIRNCTTEGNGGAIYVLPDGSFVDPEENARYTAMLKSVTIDGHYGSFNAEQENADLCGGGICMKMGILDTENCTFTNLRAPTGAAIYGRTNDSGTSAATITIKGGSITGNVATDPNGGAINVPGGQKFSSTTGTKKQVKIGFGGSVRVENNTNTNSTVYESNLVLEMVNTEDRSNNNKYKNNMVIYTLENGLTTDARIGVYVVDTTARPSGTPLKPYENHGEPGDPFGTWGLVVDTSNSSSPTFYINRGKGSADQNLFHFVNDRNGCWGETRGDDGLIYWTDPIVKVTDKDDKLLYALKEGIYYPAVYEKLTDAVTAAEGTLYYRVAGANEYTPAFEADTVGMTATNLRKLKMLKDYEMPGADNVTLSDENDNIVLTTAETDARTSPMPDNKDLFVFIPATEATGDNLTTATITRDANGTTSGGVAIPDASMFTMSGDAKVLTLTGIILDGAKGSYQPKVNGGIVNVQAGTLSVTTGTTLQNSKVDVDSTAQAGTTGLGGAVYVASGAVMNLDAGTIGGNAVASTGNGAGIYLPEGSTLNISGSPSFSENTKDETLSGKTNGGATYTTPKQDIFIAGYIGTDNSTGEPVKATSLKVTGELTNVNGANDMSIWVWADDNTTDTENNHFKQLKQFAVFDLPTGTTLTDDQKASTMKVFRNAVPDDQTEGSEALYGQFSDDDNSSPKVYIYWSGVSGYRKVILRKVEDSTYKSIEGAVFTIHKGNSNDAYKLKGETTSLSNLDSKASGVFWIGTLPYGVYYLHETTVPDGYTGHETSEGRWFFMVVGDDTVPGSRNGAYMSEGFESRDKAKEGYDTWKATP